RLEDAKLLLEIREFAQQRRARILAKTEALATLPAILFPHRIEDIDLMGPPARGVDQVAEFQVWSINLAPEVGSDCFGCGPRRRHRLCLGFSHDLEILIEESANRQSHESMGLDQLVVRGLFL